MSSLELYEHIFDSNQLQALKNCGIRTVSQFLQETPEKICVIAQLPFKTVLECSEKLLESFRSKQISAFDLYNAVQANYFVLPSGIPGFDDLIGSLRSGSIYEFCGLSGSGKTQLCIKITAHLSNLGHRIHYIDTKNEFTAKRISEILRTKLDNQKDIIANLERVTVTKVCSLYQLVDVLHQVKNISHESNPLIIIDCISTCYFLCVGSAKPLGLGLLNHVASLMKFITSQKHRIIIATNLAKRYFCKTDASSRSMTKPCLGNSWYDVCNIRINLTKKHNSAIDVSLVKNDYSECNINRCIEVSLT